MKTIVMHAGPGRAVRDFKPRSRFGPAAVAAMVAFHGLVVWALLNGLGTHMIELVKKPLEATIVQEVQLPPPPSPPRQIVKQEMPKPLTPPPPAYVPPAEVTPPVTDVAPAITAVQSTTAVATPPPVAPTPVVADAPPAPIDIKVVCPTQVPPQMPQRAIDEGVGGTVLAQATIREGAVVDVKVISGPKLLHAAVRAAMLKYRCEARGEVVARQSFVFLVE